MNVSLIVQKNLTLVASIAGLLLLIPILGNIYVDGWQWGVFDFVFAFLLLTLTGLIIDFARRSIKSRVVKIAAIIGIIGMFLLVWVEVAVDAVSRSTETLF